MEIANVLVSVGGDHGNTVPLYQVTAAEVAVLLRIHGNESVNDIDPCGEISRGNREELARLKAQYPAKDEDGKTHVEMLYPGAAARVFQTFAELELPPEMFKPIARARPTAVAPVMPAEDPEPALIPPLQSSEPEEPEELPGDDDPVEEEPAQEPEEEQAADPAPKTSRKPKASVLD